MLQLYIDLSSSRLARHAIQPIQPIQPIQLYTLYSIQHYTASLRAVPVRCLGKSYKACIRIAGYPVYNEHFPLSAYFRIALSHYPPPY